MDCSGGCTARVQQGRVAIYVVINLREGAYCSWHVRCLDTEAVGNIEIQDQDDHQLLQHPAVDSDSPECKIE